jgi:5'-nucleotidase/UDP-sugar diphosphatase
MAFAHVIPVPFRNIHRDVARDHRLASQSRMQLVIGRLFHAVELIVVHLGKIRLAFLDDDVACCTSATSAAGMFQMEAHVHRNIKQRFRLAVPFVGQFSLLKFKCLTCWKECNSGHSSDYSGPSRKPSIHRHFTCICNNKQNPVKRHFLAAVWLSSIACAQIVCAQDDIRSLSILHTNDLHAQLLPDAEGLGGFAFLAAEVRRQREGCASCIFLSAGDMVQGTPVSTLYRGAPLYELANLLGFDAAAVGNHEFDYGWKAVQGFAAIAHFPVLTDNVENSAHQFLTGKGYIIRNVGGIRVAIIGLVMSDLAGNYSTLDQVGPWQVKPIVETIHRTAAELRGRADLIIALGHLNLKEADTILAEAPEVGIAIVGHGHDGFPEMQQNGHRYAVELKAYGVELGRLDVQFDLTKHEIRAADWKRIPIDSHTIAPAPDVAKEVAKWEAKVSRIVDVPIGEAKHPFSKEQLRPLIERAMAEATGADFAFITTGDIRATLPQGKLLARKIWNMLPFEDHVLVGRFKGSELPPAITARYPVQSDREYKVAVTAFLAANQASPSQLSTTGMTFPVIGPSQRDAMLAFVARTKVLD